MAEEAIIKIIVEGSQGVGEQGGRPSPRITPSGQVLADVAVPLALSAALGGGVEAIGNYQRAAAPMILATKQFNLGQRWAMGDAGIVLADDLLEKTGRLYEDRPHWTGEGLGLETPYTKPSKLRRIIVPGPGNPGAPVFVDKNNVDAGKLRRLKPLRTIWDVNRNWNPTDEFVQQGYNFQLISGQKGKTLVDKLADGDLLTSTNQGTTGGFRRIFGLPFGPTSSASSTGGLVREGYLMSKATTAGLRTVTTPSVGSSMRLLRAGGIAGGGLALALGISAYIDNARQDAVVTAAAEGRDATGGEVMRSVHDKISSHIDGVGSFFQRVVAGVASAPGKVAGNLGVGWAYAMNNPQGAAEANRYAEDVDEYWSEAIGLKSTRQKRNAAAAKFEAARDHAKWQASQIIEDNIKRNANNFAENYLHLGIGSYGELMNLYESEVALRIREKFSKQFIDEFDKTHNKTTFIRAQLASQGD
jgi:hypothetical protein